VQRTDPVFRGVLPTVCVCVCVCGVCVCGVCVVCVCVVCVCVWCVCVWCVCVCVCVGQSYSTLPDFFKYMAPLGLERRLDYTSIIKL